MKKLWAFAVFIFSLSTFAATGDWFTQWPYMNGIRLDKLCYQGDSFKSMDPVNLCVSHSVHRKACYDGSSACRDLRAGERAYGGEVEQTEVVCNRYENEVAEFSRTREVQKCMKLEPINEAYSGRCLQWKTVQEQYPLHYKIEVYKNAGDAGMVYSHSIDYEVPECF